MEFSISHCQNYAVVVFNKTLVGIDIEEIAPRDFSAIAKRMKFELKENTLESFYEAWTFYEAKYKLQKGVKNSLTIDFADKYKLTVASSSDKEINLNIIEI